jgi:hypothetical protein
VSFFSELAALAVSAVITFGSSLPIPFSAPNPQPAPQRAPPAAAASSIEMPQTPVAPLASSKTSATPAPKPSTDKKSAATTTQTAAAAAKVAPLPSPEEIWTRQVITDTRAATINILCKTKNSKGGLISGSGVIIDSRGVILTNAHVAQYLLLKDYPVKENVSCFARTGNPAGSGNTYHVELLYLPPAWIEANAKQIAEKEPTGTGEHDFAFLRITSSVSDTIPASFPRLPMDATPPQKDEVLILAAYPASGTTRAQVQQSLYVGSTHGAVGERFTFGHGSNQAEKLSISGVFLSEHGSSGGAAAHLNSGELIGIITAETKGEASYQRSLHVITIGHIEYALREFGMGGISELLSGDLAAKSARFNKAVAPGLADELKDELTSR